jgi:ABC-type branched-subunit amino acid transport system substrate-binding protein
MDGTATMKLSQIRSSIGLSSLVLFIAVMISSFATATPARTEVRIGLLLSAETASNSMCVIEALAARSNRSGVRYVLKRFGFDDSPLGAREIATKMLEWKPDLVIGPRTTQEALATAPIFAKSQVPQILPVASHSDLTRKFSHTVRVVSSQESYSKLAAKFVARAVNPRKVTVVANTSLP